MLNRGRATLASLSLVLLACGDREEARDIPAWVLTESVRIGTQEEGPASFGQVKSLEADGQGRIWVLDLSVPEIRVFDPEGAHLNTIGRKGKGPGEFTSPEGIAFAPDGRLWVRDASGSRFLVFTADGTYEEGWTLTFCSRYGPWNPRVQAERILDLDCVVTPERTVSRAILGYHTDMSRVDTIAPKPECGSREFREAATYRRQIQGGFTITGVPWAPEPHEVVGDSGELWCVPNSSKVEILRLIPGAKDTTRVVVTTPDIPVTQAERDSAIAEFEKNGPTGYDYSRIPNVKPKVERLTVDDHGRLWVQLAGANGNIEFAILSPEGVLVATARLGAVRTESHLPFIVRGNAVYLVTFDHEDVPHVARYTISKPGN